MRNSSIQLFLLLFLLFLSPLAFSAESEQHQTYVEFSNTQKLHVQNLCLDGDYIRPKMSQSVGFGIRPRPIQEIIHFDLGHDRKFTLVRKVKTNDIQECSQSIILKRAELERTKRPTPKEMIVYSSLFQRGITIAQTDAYPLKKPNPMTMTRGRTRSNNDENSSFTLHFQSPQCFDGHIELSSRFLDYLQGPYARELYPNIYELFSDRPDYSNKHFNQIWNNHINQKPLTSFGGEGSGTGRIGFGHGHGGEGSGTGRYPEQQASELLDLKKTGHIDLKIKLDRLEFESLRYTPGLLQRIFGQDIKFKEYLLDGELIPRDLIELECKK